MQTAVVLLHYKTTVVDVHCGKLHLNGCCNKVVIDIALYRYYI